MLAILSALDSGNMRRINLVPYGENAVTFFALSYFLYLLIRKSAVPMVKAIIMAALYRCIGVVFCNRAKSQVSRIDARWIVANVHYNHSFRNFANEKFVNVAMGLRSLSVLASASSYHAITKFGVVSSPQPAGTSFFDSRIYGNRSLDALELIERSKATILHIAVLAKVSAERLRLAKQAFLFNLFHGAPFGGCVMTIP